MLKMNTVLSKPNAHTARQLVGIEALFINKHSGVFADTPLPNYSGVRLCVLDNNKYVVQLGCGLGSKYLFETDQHHAF